MSIRLKLTIMFLAIATLPLLLVSALTFTNYKNSLETNRFSQLQDLTIFRADRIDAYFAGLKAHIEISQGFYNIKKNLPILTRLADDPGNQEFIDAKKMLDAQLQQMLSVSDLSDIMLVNPQGRVVYANRPGHFLKDMSNGIDAEQKAFTEGKSRVYFSDVYFDKAEDNRFEILLTAPASDFNGAFIGVIAFEVDMTPVYKLIQDTTGLGNTGEVLIGKRAGNQVEYLNPLRHDPNATLIRRINIGGEIGRPIQEAVQGKTGTGQYFDYRGKKVIAAWRYIPSLDWGMVAKIDADEAFADVANLRNLATIILVIVIVLSGITAFSIAHSISEPIKQLSEGAAIIGSGNLDYKIGTNLKDEIGQLSRSFNKMTLDLKQTTASRDELNREIAERKEAEESLRQSEIKYRTVADNTYDWEFWLDPEGRFLYCSPSCERITGHRPEEFLADPGLRTSIIHPDDRPLFEKHLHEIEHKQKGVAEAEWRCVRPDGTFRWVAHVCQPVYDDSGRFIGIRGSNRDVTERKKAEEALRESEQHLSAVFRASPTGIFVTRLSDGLFIEANEAYLRMIGYSADEVIGHTSPELNIWVNPEDRERIVNILRKQGRIENSEVKFRRKNGEILDLLYSALPLERRGEHCILGTLTDITSRKRAEQALRQSEERYRTLFETMLEGFCIIEVVFDTENKPVDYRFLDINPAFERQTGLHDAKGKLMRNLAPAHEAHWFEIYGKIALTGEPARFENEAKALNRWYDVSAVRVGGPESRKVAILFNDISERKRAEEELRKSRDELEIRVKERTADLDETVAELQKQVQQRIKAEETIKAERKRLENVLEMMPAYAVLLTPDYHVAYANRTFRDWFGDDNGKKCYEFLFNRKEPCENCETYNVMKTGKSQFWEWTGPNGHNYDIYDYPFTDTDGSPLIMEIGVDVTAHKQTQTALRSASLYTRGLIEASLDPLVTISPEGKITDVNKATEAVTGISRERLIGSDFSNYFTEPQKARDGYKKVLAEGMVKDYPLTIRHISGHTTDVLYNATVYKNPAGKIEGVFAAARDVTEQKRMGEELRVASLYARGLIEASLDPLVTISPEGKITDVNEATEIATGVSRKQLIGSSFSSYFTDSQKANEGYKKVMSDGFVKDYPLTIRHVSGSTMDVLYNATVYKNQAGKIQGVFAAARDVTERKRAERRQGVTNSLLELYAKKTTRKDYLDSAVEVIRNWSGCSRIGVRVRDDKGNIPYESFVGFEKDFLALENPLHLGRDKCLCMRAILQQPIEQDKPLLTAGGSFYSNDSLAFVRGLSPQQGKDYRGNCMKHGFQSIAVVPIRYRDEVFGAIHLADSRRNMAPLTKIQFIETTIAPLIGEAIHRFNAESELEKYRLHLEDLVKQRTEELARSNNDLEQFAYVASHDLQEPLRAVAGFVELLRRNLKNSLDDKTTGYVNFTIDGARRMQALISGLLEYSRVGTQGKKPKKTDSRAALDEAMARLQSSIKETGAEITADDLPTVYFDDVQLSQLFQNLIGNAIKFHGDQAPQIHVSAVRQDTGWRFAVRDNGIGIEPQYAERIFMIFQRLHSREKYPGTGIGLSICKKIVERHNGKIWVESKPGNGSTFYFTVPIKEV